MSHKGNSKEKMIKQLAAFKAKHGHCNVPAKCGENLQLGRWVSATRYRRKVGELSEHDFKRLDRIGFVWSVADGEWEKAFQSLVAYKKKFKHCNVPRTWPRNQGLANWAHTQRYRRKNGKLSCEKEKRLEKIGFCWAIYKCDGSEYTVAKREQHKEMPKPREEKLYWMGIGVYVQYGGNGRKPSELKTFIENHRGEFPPYFPLPKGRTVFYLGERYIREEKIVWKGTGKLPEKILDYVREHGTLPPHE